MSDYSEYQLSVKSLECKKLREAIAELTSKCENLSEDNNNLQASISEVEDNNSVLKKRMQNLTEELADAKSEHQNCQEGQADLQRKIRQLQENNKKLMEELVQTKKQHLKVDEEIVTISDKNCRLIFDLANVQQVNSILKSQMTDAELDMARKDQQLEKLSQDWAQVQQQNISFQKEIKKLSSDLEESTEGVADKDLKIATLSFQVKDLVKKLEEQGKLKVQMEKMREENHNLRSELGTTDKNRDTLFATMLQNKNLLMETKEFKVERENLSKENIVLQERVDQYNEKVAKVTEALESAQNEIVVLKQNNEDLHLAQNDLNRSLKETRQFLEEKKTVEEQNRFLHTQCRTYSCEVEELNESLKNVFKECCNLKQKIEDLENSNIEKLKLLAKLKGVR